MISITQKKPEDGSLIFYQENFVFGLTTNDLIGKFNKSQSAIIDLIFSSEDLLDEDRVVSIKDLASKLDLKVHTAQGRIRKLNSLGLLKELKFKYAKVSDNKRQGKRSVYQLELSKLLPSTLLVEVDNSPLDTKPTCLNVEEDVQVEETLSLPKRSLKQSFKQHGLELYDFGHTNTKTAYPKVESVPVIRAEGTSIVEQLISSEVRSKGRNAKPATRFSFERDVFVRNEEGRSVKVAARFDTHSNLLDIEDLVVLFAVYSMSHYYLKMLDSIGVPPKNFIPISYRQLGLIVGRKVGGDLLPYVRDCMTALNDARINAWGAHDLNFSDEIIHMQMKKDFSLFKELRLIATGIDTTDLKYSDYEDKVTHAIVELPDQVFNSLVLGSKVFTFPQNSFRVSPVLFSIYLFFRNRYKKYSTETTKHSFHDFSKLVFSDKDPVIFKRDILKILTDQKKALESGRIVDEMLKVDVSNHGSNINLELWGFTCDFNFIEQSVSICCDHEAMLTACEADNPSTPTKKNRFQTSEQDADFSRIFQSLFKTTFNKYSCRCQFKNGQEIHLHKYLSNETINQLAISVSQNDVDRNLYQHALSYRRSQVDKFLLNDKEFEQADVDAMMSITDVDLDDYYAVNLYRRILRFNQAKRDELYDVIFNGQFASEELIELLSLVEFEIIKQTSTQDPGTFTLSGFA
ncbi:hypothetical protein AB4455_26910 [Vibrio sp. 10N.261.46.E12]|uniref:hypothetical protein n=1 Tax=unclassified Vibrio TaxID=2614977 RepID=UPI0009755525|nr:MULTISPECIES: hypothetical protein [unclassified Vibrio]OMO33112.1 hypothetical protein BH584_15395 [Vibrio sp. 10N.261.45.E1]PMJ34037.1 hypothetical protein BCU27_24850 [Vibrio sp. 10N.286.45.B6]PML84289.1 hypothetical protein BCT66_17845 [Vibrio sp. 10N.261.49.E11]PMM90296.1 hypothetical protein BCT46_23650 [Vibrio sp. 10N.261.46.E8]PMN47524.1 hypothetical protein BCT32_09445 [Vibrio sp. 10N.261.45.E11]